MLGMLAQARTQKQKLSAKVAKKYAKKLGGSGGATNGLSSTVAFTPLQVTTPPRIPLFHILTMRSATSWSCFCCAQRSAQQ